MWHNVEQNTDEPCQCCGKTWMELRAGKVTGSAKSLGAIMANYGKAFGDPAKRLAISIASIEMGGTFYESNYTNSFMDRGHELEPIAKKAYEDYCFVDVSNPGFFDNGRTGVSPDGLVGNDIVVEIKVQEPHIHYACIKRGSFQPSYKWQHVFEMRESGIDTIDSVSFCPSFPPGKELYISRHYISEFKEELEQIETRLNQFWDLVDEAKDMISNFRAI